MWCATIESMTSAATVTKGGWGLAKGELSWVITALNIGCRTTVLKYRSKVFQKKVQREGKYNEKKPLRKLALRRQQRATKG